MTPPAAKAWFWTPMWQAGEREVDEYIRDGEVLRFADADKFLAYLQEIGGVITEK